MAILVADDAVAKIEDIQDLPLARNRLSEYTLLTNKLPLIPTPPATVIAPLVVDVDVVLLDILRLPPILTDLAIPTPPATIKAPVDEPTEFIEL